MGAENKNGKYDRVDWEHFDLETGESVAKGSASLSNSNRLIGPGVNNALISRLKKGETVELEFEALGLKGKYVPRQSAW